VQQQDHGRIDRTGLAVKDVETFDFDRAVGHRRSGRVDRGRDHKHSGQRLERAGE
jgi:hypothetical protein